MLSHCSYYLCAGGNTGTAEERSRAMAATDRLSRSSDQIQRSLQVRMCVYA
jgi:hypothetical protein